MLHKKRESSKKKISLVILIFFLISIAIYFFYTNKFSTKSSSDASSNPQSGQTQQVQIIPLSDQEKEIVTKTILSSDFIKDVPEEDPIAIRFYKFEDGKRVWQDGFLIGNNQILAGGSPSIYLTLHSKYISEINEENLCEVIKKAKENGDLGFETELGNTQLLWKYKEMLSHRDCFGL